MNKNTTIAILVIIVIIGIGYFVSKSRDMSDVKEDTSLIVPGDVKTDVKDTTPAPLATTKPDAPLVQTTKASTTSSSTASVTGSVRPNGASTTYWFEYGETTALGARTSAQGIGSGFTLLATPGYITGLKANTLYYFRLSAKNSFATVNGATYTFNTNTTPPVTGRAPTIRTNDATNVVRTTATLKGEVNPNGNPTTYWFEYGKENNFGFVTSLQSAGSGTSITSVSFDVSGLEPLTKYYFRLNGQNQYGTVNGPMENFTTAGPVNASAPTVETTAASNVSDDSARLNGRVTANGADTNYWFEYSQDSLLGNLIGSGTTKQIIQSSTDTKNVQATISGLQNDTRYYYRLIAQNQYGTVRGDIESVKTTQ
ncbi:MAG: hypothetical protein V4665_02965 [Patescibacteria group bacterium]